MVGPTRWQGALLALLLALYPAPQAAAESSGNRFLDAAWDADFIRNSIAAETRTSPPDVPVTGVGVPHHLAAPDLIARGLLAASGTEFDTVLLIAPDHFRSTDTPFGVTTGPIPTVFGTLESDPRVTAPLLTQPGLFTDVGTAPKEHGIHSISPFVAAIFPGVRFVAITATAKSKPADWEAAVAILTRVTGPRTLVVQSTDYSHFLPHRLALHRDQETLSAIASGALGDILALNQPSHLDSLAAQYIQTALQARRFGSSAVVLANRNSHENDPAYPGKTTSYVVTAYVREPSFGSEFTYRDQSIFYLAGDTFLGRGMAPVLAVPSKRDAIVTGIRRTTGGHPLILNLEGVILSEAPVGRNTVQHLMMAETAVPVLARLGTVAASTANNHSHDFGPEGLLQTHEYLTESGILPLQHGQIADLGALRILPLTFRRSYFSAHQVVRDPAEIYAYCSQPAEPPLIALLHWGDDYVNRFGTFEKQVIAELERCGVSAVVGSHSHVASTAVAPLIGGAVPTVVSTGNFLFDQDRPEVSGALVEVRVFAQGTIALRLVPLENIYAKWRAKN